MAGLSSSDLAQVLKIIYPKGVPLIEMYKKCPTLALMPKNTEWAGISTKFPLIWGAPQGASADLATAIANKSASKHAGFDVTCVDDYAVWGITGKAIAQSRNDQGAFVRYLKVEMDGAMETLKRSAHHSLFRNGGGALGQISATSTVASQTITLANKYDVVFFEVGQVLVSSATDGTTGSARTGGTGQTVSAIDRTTGTITGTQDWNVAITGCLAGDYLFRDGDFGLKMLGLDAWLPQNAPGATSFYGVNRSLDTVRLGGTRLPTTSADKPIDETLLDLLDEVDTNGGSTDVIVLHNKQWTSLEKRMLSKVIYSEKVVDIGTAKLGFRSIVLKGPSGDVNVIADRNTLIDTAFALQLDTWELGSMGEQFLMLDDDGLPFLRTSQSDEIEGRLVSRPGLACKAPGFNGRALLSTNGL